MLDASETDWQLHNIFKKSFKICFHFFLHLIYLGYNKHIWGKPPHCHLGYVLKSFIPMRTAGTKAGQNIKALRGDCHMISIFRSLPLHA